MGCDMHAHMEIKVNGQWHHYSQPSVNRNYDFFSALAGVRRYGDTDTPIAGGRGIPTDATFTTRFDYEKGWGSDAHSPSWISDKECLKLEEQFEAHNLWCDIFDHAYLFGNYITSPMVHPSDAEHIIKAGYEEARIVFWFDN